MLISAATHSLSSWLLYIYTRFWKHKSLWMWKVVLATLCTYFVIVHWICLFVCLFLSLDFKYAYKIMLPWLFLPQFLVSVCPNGCTGSKWTLCYSLQFLFSSWKDIYWKIYVCIYIQDISFYALNLFARLFFFSSMFFCLFVFFLS